jgi:hypothetical protein
MKTDYPESSNKKNEY